MVEQVLVVQSHGFSIKVVDEMESFVENHALALTVVALARSPTDYVVKEEVRGGVTWMQLTNSFCVEFIKNVV